MTQRHASVADAGAVTKQAIRRTRPWLMPLARAGYVAKGVVYTVIGLLALRAALYHEDNKVADTQGALGTIVQQPFGQFLLVLVTVGLVGYALWRVVQAALDTENAGAGMHGILKRLGFVISGLAYGFLAFTAVELILGRQHKHNSTGTQHGTERLLALPFGPWLVGIVGIVVCILGLGQFHKAYRGKFQRKLQSGQMSDIEQKWAKQVGRVGLAARGVVFGIIGYFLIQAARQDDSQEARGMAGAQRSLGHLPFGPWVLGVVAVGLIAYGFYMFIEARYRRLTI
jgi:hypothetical protein